MLPVAGNTERTRPENRAIFPALDGLRAIAFCMVFLDHYMDMPWGWAGVDLFFVLSGFLITGILIDTRDHSQRMRNFYIRRTLRIFPLYYGLFAVLFLSTPLVHWVWSREWIGWLVYAGNYLTFLPPAQHSAFWAAAADGMLSSRSGLLTLRMSHFWSLCVEEQFYLAWPWVVFSIARRRTLLLLSASIVVAEPLLRLLLWHHPHHIGRGMLGYIFYKATPFRLDSLLIGACVAILYRSSYRQLLLEKARWAALLCSIVTVVYILHSYRHRLITDQGNNHEGWHYLSFIALFAASILLLALRPGTPLYRLLTLRPLRKLGQISYGAYVFHLLLLPVLSRAVGLHRPHWLGSGYLRVTVAAIAFCLALVMAALSYRYWESPFLNLKEKWAPSIRPSESLNEA